MKFFFTLLLVVVTTTFTQAQALLGEGSKLIFISPQLSREIGQHKKVAILPFSTKIAYRVKPQNFNAPATREQEANLAKNMQHSLYTYLLRKAKSHSVSFQDVEITNALLQQAGMYNKLDEFTSQEIAQALGVDAVIAGKFDKEQTRSPDAALTTTADFGKYAGKFGLGTLTITIYNGQTGEMLWRFFKSMDDDFSSGNHDIVARMLRKVTRNFPSAI